MTDVVPFGKYRGKDVAELVADRKYCDWLQAQPWFREKYGNVYNVIVLNGRQEEQDTPEHNKLQALFLDDELCLSVIGKTISNRTILWCHGENVRTHAGFTKEEGKPHVEVYKRQYVERETIDMKLRDIFPVKWRRFENSGFDVLFNEIAVELKPQIGDDYPAIIRQVESARRRCSSSYDIFCVIYESFSSYAVTEAQMKKIMLESGIHAIRLSELIPSDGAVDLTPRELVVMRGLITE